MGASEATTTPGCQATHRILYADDMKELRDVVTASLAREGYEIECVPSGWDALRRLLERPGAVDLLITDHHMPGMDGIELVRKVRERKIACRVMVFCSALSREVHDCYRDLGVDRMLYKPVLPAELRQVIREVLSPRS
jgi:two-component system chemotaxis response regulator CheY